MEHVETVALELDEARVGHAFGLARPRQIDVDEIGNARRPARQQQLVSIMRALIVEPEILFLDEPFSALDYEMTLFMREQLQRVFVETSTTTVLVSHDLEEAVYLSDRILLLSRHPARAVEFVHYDAPRPRTLQTMSEADFISTKAHCLEVFQREVHKG